MAMDGSFRVDSTLEKFLARCPNLQHFPQFDTLTEKGCTVGEDDVVNTLAELFIHPNYTITLIGCFRPIAEKIIDKAVSLLRLVRNLRTNVDYTTCQIEQDKILSEVINVIEFYDQGGRGLDLHELSCLAFCRALDFAPFLLRPILSYFEFSPPPFERISMEGPAAKVGGKAGITLLLPARISYRILLMEPDIFSKFWDWSCFLDLVKFVPSVDPDRCSDVGALDSDIRWCAKHILSVIQKTSYESTLNLSPVSQEAFACLLRWEEFCQDTSLEKARCYVELSEEDKVSNTSRNNINLESSVHFFNLCSPAFSTSILDDAEPPMRSRRLSIWDDEKSFRNSFVLVSSMMKSFEMILLALSQKWPVLLYGPPGSGKSALINKLAKDSQNQVLFINMDDQIDGKTLIGNYVCTERPGEFRWQPGSLTQAVQNGFWVVFEDIDRASSDVQSILLPLLEGLCSLATGHGEEVRVAENFRLFSTISTSKLDSFHCSEGGCALSVLWRKVIIRPPSKEDLQNIIINQYPLLGPIAMKLIETFERANSSFLHQVAGFCPSDCNPINYYNRFSLRDLLKLCNRITGLGFSFVGDHLSGYQSQCIYQEAVDMLAAFSTSAENRLTIMKEIAKLWAVPTSLAETLYPCNKPSIQESLTDVRIGRVHLPRSQTTLNKKIKPFVEIHSSLHLLERIACSVKYNEAVLLVGETGTGKTTIVQNLASRLGQKLTVLNLSQQSDVADLLGGFKPIDAQYICFSLYKEFEDLFSRTFSSKVNGDFLSRLQKHFGDKNWRMLLTGFRKGVKFFEKSVDMERPCFSKKRKKPLDEEKVRAWEKFSVKLENALAQMDTPSGMIFSFVEGVFVTALRNGEWILLDEINLAPQETLQRVIGVLEGGNGSLCLAERGDVSYISRHPNFRIFACMNPATDTGKRDLTFSLQSRFTEYFVDDVLKDEDLAIFVNQFMSNGQRNRELVTKIVSFYKAAKMASEKNLQDGANQKPQYSLRSLYRALEYTRKAERIFSFPRALYDGFCMFFLTMLDPPSTEIMNKMIVTHLLGGKVPHHTPFDSYLSFKEDTRSDDLSGSYVLTKCVREHLRNLARAILIKRYPVLLQGPTSSGKTSLVKYLAVLTGHEFIRINNHEHTDLQEYLGTYITDVSGNLVFQEGMLVKAVRNGFWIVLDELNLAPSDVLEALNRLLDDNRELFVPELGETIQAHPDFMLFATQNPPTLYGGRKMLSRAFRNRFVEIHVDEIPEDEMITIVEKRCEIPENYAKKMIEVMKELQLHRQSSKIFAGKHGFITPRDLFRWAYRFKEFGCSYTDLARDGYYLLAERLRNEEEKYVVQDVIERHLRVKLTHDELYKEEPFGGACSRQLSDEAGVSGSHSNIIMTKSMERLCFLVERCSQNSRYREPVLLVGETGGGKTTVCQLLSAHLRKKLHILNCHQYTDTSDFIGGFYPIRDRSRLISKFKNVIEGLISRTSLHFHPDITMSTDIEQASSTLQSLERIITRYRQSQVLFSDVSLQDLEHLKKKVLKLHQKWHTIFMWQDGPLVQAMKNGDLFLVDEISLADDSVLERLNSVLEPERKLSLPEKGGSTLETITAHPDFFLFATMNPGGDYGKKELSPALRNRFTEIWVPSVSNLDELRSIALTRFSNPKLEHLVGPMLSFWEWFNKIQSGRLLTVRDLLSWVSFINSTERSLGPEFAFLHGAFLVLLDGLSLGTGLSKRDSSELRERSFYFLLEKLEGHCTDSLHSKFERLGCYGWGDFETDGVALGENMKHSKIFGIDPFYIEKGYESCDSGKYEFLAPTTQKNALRLLRAMQLSKPVLLEGSPGVGKTSLIVALGEFSGHRVVRINLSEQTDIMDLLGADLPVETEEGINFAWSDGILLQALKEGSWVLLDELNLAPQSVLEGLNSILDHRAEVFIPELGLTYKCPPSFKIFGCQNPSCQGGGRKNLPKSFLNRFTKVYLDELLDDDYLSICSSLFKSIPRPLLMNLILFNKRLHEEIVIHQKFAQGGSPWEFNLRDVVRCCQIIEGAPEALRKHCFLNVVYIQRMRSAGDRREVQLLYERIFNFKPFINPYPRVLLNHKYLVVGNTAIERNVSQLSNISTSQLKIIPGIRHSLEAVSQCVQHQWLCILVGPSSSGKTSLIRLLAQLTGNVLNELNLSAATDISELLGCFEQYNAFRNFRTVLGQVEHHVNKYCDIRMKCLKEEFGGKGKELIAKWIAFSTGLSLHNISSSISVYMENWKRVVSSLGVLVEIIEQLMLYLKENGFPINLLDKAMKTVVKLQESCGKNPFSAKFEWIIGILIKAIENGEWIILKNANLCNPTVLDRINSLVEPNGSITINECGTVDGKPVSFHPHRNFHIFLTVNPSYGEVSRAMRNRGVEIFMMEPYWVENGGCGLNYQDVLLMDVKRFVVLSGIPGAKLVESMAKAHIYAILEGLQLNVRVTLLELSRWIQLFQQLVMSGNMLIWSLHISWEHTYLSSLGDAKGDKIINHAKIAYLSEMMLSEHDLSWASLHLPGGWPVPSKIRDLVWYSDEACVKQNCMYLEFLGTECASYSLGITSKRFSETVTASTYSRTFSMDMKMLCEIMLPKASSTGEVMAWRKTEFDLVLANKKFLFAANWTIEQASERDLELYIFWFTWFSSRLQPFCQIFDFFLMSVKQVIKHPVWNYICHSRHKITSICRLDLDLHPIPILTTELINMVSQKDSSEKLSLPRKESELSKDQLKSSCIYLCNAIKCVSPLLLSYQQWNYENRHEFTGEARSFVPLLKSLRELEEEFSYKLFDSAFNFVESPSFDALIQLYCCLIDNHKQFWDCLTSSKFEELLVSWHSLMKGVANLKIYFPESVEILQRESQNLENVSSWCFRFETSLLWLHGGHPILPPSSDLYHKQNQLVTLCESIWPVKMNSWSQAMELSRDKVMLLSNSDLRILAMQGLSMAACMIEKCRIYDVETSIVQHMEDIYQALLKRLEIEKHKLEALHESKDQALYEENSSTCCSLGCDMLVKESCGEIWLQTSSIIDNASFFLDMELLHKILSVLLIDAENLKEGLGNVSDLIKFVLDFSLTFSSRPPQMFSAHQNLLWTLEEWSSINRVKAKVTNLGLDLWFRWHQSLWTPFPDFVKHFSKGVDYNNLMPYLPFQPVNAAAVFQILQSPPTNRNIFVQRLKIKVASRNLWCSPPIRTKFFCFLLSTAFYLFQQIIFAHRKSFDADVFASIKSALCAFERETVTQERIRHVCSLIMKSNHCRLKCSVDMFIEPFLRELYLHCGSEGCHYNVGRTWLTLASLRLYLLLSCGNLDPAMKYHFKYLQLAERKSSLELDIQVRQESEYLAGLFSLGDPDKGRVERLENLVTEQRKLQKKIVFRSDTGKFKKLKLECDVFFDVVNFLVTNIETIESQQIVERVHNLQETATRFIDRLSNDYGDYIDIVQPVQIAVYEMKLGLSLVLSSVCSPGGGKMHGDENILEAIYTFMRFPQSFSSSPISIYSNGGLGFYSHDTISSANFCGIEKIVNLLCENPSAYVTSVSQLRAALHYNILVRLLHYVANHKVMDRASFVLSDKIFSEFANLWMSMKVQAKTKEEYDSQVYKFRPRAFKIESVIDSDTNEDPLLDDGSLKWEDVRLEENNIDTKESCKQETSEDELSFMEESMISQMIHIHDQLFGSCNLLLPPRSFLIADADRLRLFSNSYTLGIEMMRDLGLHFLSGLDAKLAPEHLLRLCLEHEEASLSAACKYNFYKDSNTPVMSKMGKLLGSLQQQISSLLCELEDHHGLQKLLDISELLLNLPIKSPISKALSGLQVLVRKVQMLQENGSKFNLADQLEPIIIMICKWRKLEIDSWPAMLNGVQEQYEMNAAKLWFPLYSVLKLGRSADITEYDQSTMLSLMDFIHTASIGEFRRRLQLLFSFLGQIYTSRCLNIYSSECEGGTFKVLYNIFGYYVQFLPIILEHVEDIRRKVELELKEIQKLCRWEHSESCLSIENSRTTRLKLRKLIQKYSDLLQQPVVLFLDQDIAQKVQSIQFSFDLNNEDRFSWIADWRKEVCNVLQFFHLEKNHGGNILARAGDVATMIRQDIVLYPEEWKTVWCTLETIYENAVRCGDLWKDAINNQGKRRALSVLFKLLEGSGLSRHKSIYLEDQLKSWWFLKPSYDIQYLLLTPPRLSHGSPEVAVSRTIESLQNEGLVVEWKRSSGYYYKSIASVLLLQQICLNSHKDISKEQVERSCAFLNQLVEIQQKQQAAANHFAKHLQSLKQCLYTLKKQFANSNDSHEGNGDGTIIQNQQVTYKCMWQQKHLFDGLCAMMHEELLMLKTFNNTHTFACQSLKDDVNSVTKTIEKFLPAFLKSKELLDDYLLNNKGEIIIFTGKSYPFFVTKQMKELVLKNFSAINSLKEHLPIICKDIIDRSAVGNVLLSYLQEVFEKGSLLEREFKAGLDLKNECLSSCGMGTSYLGDYSELNIEFNKAFELAFEHIMKAVEIFLPSKFRHVIPEEYLGNLTSWEVLFNSYTANLDLDSLCDKILKAISCGVKLLIHSPEEHSKFGSHLKQLNLLSNLVVNFGDCLLRDVLSMHDMVSAVTNVLAINLANLYAKGFGTSAKEQLENEHEETSQDVNGTGMGEGAGLNDVSDQMLDEDQLLGADDKVKEEQDKSSEVPSKNDKGIEMEQDFDADTFSVSEDSGEESEDNGDEKLESAIGDTGANGEAVDEKLRDKDEDENHNDEKEKYKDGPSVRDGDGSSRELKAKDTASADEEGEVDPAENERSDKIESPVNPNDDDDMDEMNLNKDEAFGDPTELELEESNQASDEDLEIEEREVSDSMEEGDHEDSSANADNEEEKTCPIDEKMEVETNQDGRTSEKDHMDHENMDHEEGASSNMLAASKDEFQPGTSDFIGDRVQNPESDRQLIDSMDPLESKNMAPESNWSSKNEGQNSRGLSSALPSGDSSEMDILASDSKDGGKLTHYPPKSQLSQDESLPMQKPQTNPYRNIGDALEEWIERANVSVDLQTNNVEIEEEIEDKDAKEYGYVSEFEKGTAQALGSATSEQVDRNTNCSNVDRESPATNSKELAEMEIERLNSEAHSLRSCTSVQKNTAENQMHLSSLENLPNGGPRDVENLDNGNPQSLAENLVSVRKSYLNEPIDQLRRLSVSDELGKAKDPAEFTIESKDNATTLWRRYELLTTRLSQELAEQLRLVMEPTLASKLQGDYKTGKRINMKKVIPYIASHYRKDKIWLRRTRPNKRDYQIIIAVDDSRSMSESGCGDVAIEALVTVCRAMSILEMGSLAVASFGEKGNINLLHDFDQPFTGEVGMKMMSSFTFMQENSITDEPVLDLVKYLNNMLDTAVAKARHPSGQNPLQQLVLIIADGRFHEKDKLKRYVRESLSRKRMVAFLLLDSPQESIMDLMEASFEGGHIKFSKYLDSFPFPFYIVLKNIEALPRTLADLLRQWFELMQQSKE